MGVNLCTFNALFGNLDVYECIYCRRMCRSYIKYNLASRVFGKRNYMALFKNCVFRCMYIYMGVYEPSLFRHVFKVTLMKMVLGELSLFMATLVYYIIMLY